jgi:hypothetical protein
MDQSPYRPPFAQIRDIGPEGPGPLHDLLAIVIGLAVAKFLTMVASEEITLLVIDAIGADPANENQQTPFLWLDAVLSCGSELIAFWMTWRLSRSRRLRVPATVAVLSWLITFVHRWLLNDFGYPQSYELALLATAPCAFVLFHLAVRRRRALHVA